MTALANNTKVLLGGYDLSEFLREVSSTSEVDVIDATTFAKTWKVKKSGLRDSSLDADALYDQRSAIGATHDALDDVLPVVLGQDTVPVTVVKEGDSFGAIGYAILATASKYDIKTKIDDLVMAPFTLEGNGKDRVYVLHPLVVETTTGNGTDHDDGASSTNGAVGILQATDISAVGGDTLTVKVQHSTDGITWVDLITFTAVTADHKAERIEVPVGTTINRHIRSTRTLSAGASATFHVAFARR